MAGRDTDPESTAAQLIATLAGEGEPVDTGQFSLDPAAAAAKLAEFAYADRSAYLLPIAEGLFGLGAQRIDVETRAGALRIRGRGARLDDPERSLTELYASALGWSGDPARRALGRLAVGIDMALGVAGTERVLVERATRSQVVRAECRRRSAPVLSRAEPEPQLDAQALELRIEHAGSGAAVHAAALVQLRAAVRSSRRTVELDGELISRRERSWIATVTGTGQGYRFSAGFEPDEEAGAAIELWVAHVCVETLPGVGESFCAAIELDAPRRDLSQLRVVRDATVERALAAVAEAHATAKARLEAEDARWTLQTRPLEWPRARVDRVLGRPGPGPRPVAERSSGLRGFVGLVAALSPGLVLTSVIGLLGAAWVAGISVVDGELEPQLPWLAAALLLAAGATAGASLLRLRMVLEIRDHGQRAWARVVRIEQVGDDATDPHHRVVWSLTDADGRPHEGRSFSRRDHRSGGWVVGDEIEVFYDPARPHESWWADDVGPRQRRA